LNSAEKLLAVKTPIVDEELMKVKEKSPTVILSQVIDISKPVVFPRSEVLSNRPNVSVSLLYGKLVNDGVVVQVPPLNQKFSVSASLSTLASSDFDSTIKSEVYTPVNSSNLKNESTVELIQELKGDSISAENCNANKTEDMVDLEVHNANKAEETIDLEMPKTETVEITKYKNVSVKKKHPLPLVKKGFARKKDILKKGSSKTLSKAKYHPKKESKSVADSINKNQLEELEEPFEPVYPHFSSNLHFSPPPSLTEPQKSTSPSNLRGNDVLFYY
jgi:hypothetical protein